MAKKMKWTDAIDELLDGAPDNLGVNQVDGKALAIHRLARAVEALAKLPVPLLPLQPPQPIEPKPLVATPLDAPKGVIAVAYVCEHCNARNVVAEKIQHSPNCPLNPVRKGK